MKVLSPFQYLHNCALVVVIKGNNVSNCLLSALYMVFGSTGITINKTLL